MPRLCVSQVYRDPGCWYWNEAAEDFLDVLSKKENLDLVPWFSLIAFEVSLCPSAWHDHDFDCDYDSDFALIRMFLDDEISPLHRISKLLTLRP